MPEPPSPALLKFVRRSVRRTPDTSLEEIFQRWRAEHPDAPDVDLDMLHAVYDAEQTNRRGPRPRDPHHSRIVAYTIAAWIAAHAVLLAVIAGPACALGGGPSAGCGLAVALISLGIGTLQLGYGLVAGALVSSRRPAVAQGLFIGAAIVALTFTVLCFTAPATIR